MDVCKFFSPSIMASMPTAGKPQWLAVSPDPKIFRCAALLKLAY